MSEALFIVQGYQSVLNALDLLSIHLKQDLADIRFWVVEQESSTSAQDKTIEALSLLTPAASSPQQTYACPGAIGGNQKTIHLVHEVNAAKDQFKTLAKQYLAQLENKDTQLIRQILKHAGFSAVKLRQVYRHIRWIDYHPRRISFTKVKHNSHQIITPLEAQKRLHKKGQGPHIAFQQSKLKTILSHELLVIHRDVQPIWAANLSTFKNEVGQSQHQKLVTSIPLVYRYDDTLPLPQIGLSTPHPNKKSTVRADKQIEDHPFISSLSGYRYKKDL